MRSYDKKPVYYFQADASTVGGSLESPEAKIIPQQASVSLSAVGGYATAQTGGFNLDQIVSVKSAYARVAGRVVDRNGSVSTLVTAVIEGLNILEVVTADRIVAQLAVEGPVEEVKRRLIMTTRRISVAGAHFEGLRIAGVKTEPKLNAALLPSKCREEESAVTSNTWESFQQQGVAQATRLVKAINRGAYRGMEWVKDRYEWMTSNEPKEGFALCSLVDSVGAHGTGVDDTGPCVPGTSLGHIVEIPDFGRIFLGELVVSPLSVQLTMIRAELGCNVAGTMAIGGTHINGTTVPPGK